MLSNDTIDRLQANLTGDLGAFTPELILCGGIVVLLLLRLFTGLNRVHLGWVAVVIAVAGLLAAVGQWLGGYGLATPADFLSNRDGHPDLFTGLLVYDSFTLFLRLFLLGFTALIIWLTLVTGIPDTEDSADFYTLLLGAIVGMSLMASANHLLMIYVGVEMASLPSYALAGFLKGRRQSSEASLKYVVYGGGASGIMLYGISLLAGKFGTAYLPDLAAGYVAALHPTAGALPIDPILLLATLFVLIGVGFKLAAVPFHFWCPDVFEGASAEVAGFLSVASKGAALALLGRIVIALTGLDPSLRAAPENWMSLARFLVPAIGVFAVLTATFGNLAAYLQTNLKRLLAYSTIAHAGYMMMGLAALVGTSDPSAPPAEQQVYYKGAGAVLFYLVAYLFMNLGAFAVVAFLRNALAEYYRTHPAAAGDPEDLSSYRGLVSRSPWMVVTLSIFLLSLLGLPPLAGFAAKFQVFQAIFEAGDLFRARGETLLAWTMYSLLVIGGLNTVFSAVYYLKVMKVMILDTTLEDVEHREPQPLREPWSAIVFSGLVAAMIFVVGILWGPLEAWSKQGVDQFRPGKAVAQRAGGAQP